MEQKIKVASTVYPEKPLSQNKWFKKFKVGTRVRDRYIPSDRIQDIHSQYNFSVLFEQIKKQA